MAWKPLTNWLMILTDTISIANFYHYEFVIQDPTTKSFFILKISFFYGNTWLM